MGVLSFALYMNDILQSITTRSCTIEHNIRVLPRLPVFPSTTVDIQNLYLYQPDERWTYNIFL
jgi:hypothetical protein